jgi:hypothetical protein
MRPVRNILPVGVSRLVPDGQPDFVQFEVQDDATIPIKSDFSCWNLRRVCGVIVASAKVRALMSCMSATWYVVDLLIGGPPHDRQAYSCCLRAGSLMPFRSTFFLPDIRPKKQTPWKLDGDRRVSQMRIVQDLSKPHGGTA